MSPTGAFGEGARAVSLTPPARERATSVFLSFSAYLFLKKNEMSEFNCIVSEKTDGTYRSQGEW